MSARELLDRLEKDGLLEDAVIADLRRQLSEASRGVTAESVAKLLVDNGHLTKFQATKLINEVTAEIEQRKGRKAAVVQSKRSEAEKNDKKKSAAPEADLLLAPLSDQPPAPARPAAPQTSRSSGAAPAAGRPKPPAVPEDDELILGDTAEAARPAKSSKPKPPTSKAKPAPSRTAPVITESELAPLEDQPQLDPLSPPATSRSGRAGRAAVANAERKRTAPAAPTEVLDELEPVDDVEPIEQSEPTSAAAAFLAKKKRARENPWDSPLMLVGGGVLVLLLVLGFALYRSMTRGTAQEIFAAAEEDYRNAAYANAIEKYEQMLSSFPYDTDAGKARVKKEMARFRMVAEGGRNPERALATAQEILPPLKEEPDFQVVREELASLLPDIALAFAQQAQNAQSVEEAEKLLQSADAAMELVEDPAYIPTSLRKTITGVISRVQETMALVRRDIGRNRELDAAVASMNEALQNRQPQEAYRIRDELVTKYPILERHPRIIESVAAISQVQRDLVEVAVQTVEGSAEDPEASGNSIVVSTRSGGAVPGVDGQTVAVLAQGSVYGLDAATGKVLWRRFVGHGSEAYPDMFSKEPGADVLVTLTADHEVMRVAARTGEVVWRLRIGEPFYAPVVWRDRVLVTTHSGFVWSIDATNGKSSRQTNIGQKLPMSVGADPRVAQLYQVGENDNLYVLSPESMECRAVYYLGHRSGTIVVPPTPAVGRLFIAENAGPDYALVHCLTLDADGIPQGPAQEPIRLAGQIVRSPESLGRRLIYTTTQGAIHVLDINPDAQPPVVEDIKPLPATRSEAVASFVLAERGKLWVADQRLVRYDIQASQGQLARRGIENEGDTFVGPLQRVGPALVHIRRAANAPGFRVAAVDHENEKTVYWETDIAAPVLEMFPVADGVAAITARGGLIRATADSMQQGLVEAAGNDQVANLVFDAAVPLGNGRYAVFSSAGRALVIDVSQGGRDLRLMRLNIPERAATTAPIAMDGGLLVPLVNGQITLLSLTTGDNQVLPFHPAVEAGSRVNWRRPALIPDAPEFVVADGRSRAYRVGIVETGRPHLEAFESVTLDEEPITGFTVLGERAWAGVRRSDSDALLPLQLPRLEAGEAVPVKGRIVWGPERVGNAVLVATDEEGVIAIAESGERQWAAPVALGGVAGVSVAEQDYLVATVQGELLRLGGQDGRVLAKTDVGEPLASGPVQSGSDWWVATYDGTLHRVAELEPVGN